jgi:hypothetical protein
MRKLLIIIAFSGMALAACSGGDSGSGAPATAPAAAAAPAPAAMPSAAEFASGVIDHSRDEKEFELRRTLGGVDRMIEQYKADGYDTTDLQSQKAELEASLSQLLNG